ncbi:MAG: hypothetical protein ACXQTM_05250 [Methanosarcinales archaeon]
MEILVGQKEIREMLGYVAVNRKPGEEVVLKARGQHIKRAFDFSEILLRSFLTGYKYGEIKPSTEFFTDENGKDRRVTSVEIRLVPSEG